MSRTPSPAEAALIEAARSFAPQIYACRDAIERERRLPPALFAAMAEAGLFRLWAPRSLGGAEAHPETFLRVVEEIARIDGAAGWNVMIGAVHSAFAAWLPESEADAVFGRPESVVAGQPSPVGRAVVVPGGYRVSGRWRFASGSPHSAWLFATSIVHDGEAPRLENGAPEARVLFAPASEGTLLDTWHTGGLRGTGSHDYTLEDVFVPEARSFSLQTGRPREPGTLYALGLLWLLVFPICCVPLGIARGAIDTFIDLAQAKTPTGQTSLLRERAAAQADVARAEALLRAARAFLLDLTDDAWQAALAGEPPSKERVTLLRLASTHAAQSAAQAVDLVYNAAGATAIYESSPLERAFRDVHAAAQHILTQSIGYELAGQWLLGGGPS